jgi:hypothetical protein
MNDSENLIKNKKSYNKEEIKDSEEKLKYYTSLYKLPKYLEKVT